MCVGFLHSKKETIRYFTQFTWIVLVGTPNMSLVSFMKRDQAELN